MNDDNRSSQFAENFRFYVEMRFKQLALFLTAMTAAGVGVAEFPMIRWWVALGALFVTAVIWVMEVRSTIYATEAFESADLGPSLKTQFWPWLNAGYVVLLLYIASYTLWLLCIRAWFPACISFYIGVFVGLILFVSSIVNYWQHKFHWFGRDSPKIAPR
jgi:hypothetical protein